MYTVPLQYSAYFRHIKGTVPVSNPVGGVETFKQGYHLVGFVIMVSVRNGIYIPGIAGPHKRKTNHRLVRTYVKIFRVR